MKKSLLATVLVSLIAISTVLFIRRQTIHYAPPQPGLEDFRDLEEIAFYLYMSHHQMIEVRARRLELDSNKPIDVHVKKRVYSHSEDVADTVEHSSSEWSILEFKELEEYILRQDVFSRSLHGSPETADGSAWVLEGRKGDLVLRHRRLNPTHIDYRDEVFVLIGRRVLDMAGVKYNYRELY